VVGSTGFANPRNAVSCTLTAKLLVSPSSW